MVIHLITAGKYQDPNKWPNIWRKCYKSWEGCPYKIKIWNNEKINILLKEDDEEFFNILNNLPPIYKWDYVRYIILEKFGGAYFDMDVEIIDSSFFNKLPLNKMFFMEGTSGSYLENSIMITPINLYYEEFWEKIKNYAQYIVKSSPKTTLTPHNVQTKVGSGMLSKFFLDKLLNSSSTIRPWEILGYHQFGCPSNNGIVFTKHYNTSLWSIN